MHRTSVAASAKDDGFRHSPPCRHGPPRIIPRDPQTCFVLRRLNIGSARASISAIQNDRPRSFASKYQSLGASDRRSPTLAFADAIYLSLGRRHRSARLKRRRTRRGPCLEPQRAGSTRGVCLCRRDSLGRVLTSSIRGAHRRTFQQVFLHRRASALRCLHFVRRYAQFALHPRRTEILPDSRRATPPPFAPR
jgi:hypothetical protein